MRGLASAPLALLLALGVGAQEKLRVQGPSPATVELGGTTRVNLVVEGRSVRPRTPVVPAVAGVTCQVMGPSRRSFSSWTPSGMVQEVTTTYTLEFRPERAGDFTIPAFAMYTGSRDQKVPEISFRVVKEMRGAEFGYMDVTLQPRQVYVHEPIRVRVEFGVDASQTPVQDRASNGTRYRDIEVQASWLTEMEGAEPLELAQPTGDIIVVVLNRRLQVAEYDSAARRNGRAYNSYVFYKSFLPTRPGRLKLEAPLLRYQVQQGRARRGLFGEQVGGQRKDYYVYGKPIEVEVLPIPEEGRPSPFYGAIGRFTVSAAADRNVVKVGSSVKLTFTIRGQGNFEFLRVPDLADFEAHGLHLLGQTEKRDAEEAVVTYDLTPLSADVTEIPPIRWNFFDTSPAARKFVEVETQPMALTVEPLADRTTLAPLADEERKAVTPGVDDIYDLPDLSGPAATRAGSGSLVVWLVSIGPWVLVALLAGGLAFRRRRMADPIGAKARKARRTFTQELAGGADPAAALTAYLGDRLGVPPAAVIGPDLRERLVAAGVGRELAEAVAGAVEQGTAARYGGTGGIDEQAARSFVAQLESTSIQRSRSALAWLVALGLAAAAPAQVQDGFDAYRDGDYKAAEAAFAEALDKSEDRRLWFARGNCFYRLGDLPRARWAYECALLGMPRDAELRANLELVRRQLAVGDEGQSFTAAVAGLRDRFSEPELVVFCGVSMLAAAILLGLLRRRPLARWLGLLVLLPGALLAVELLWLRPARPAMAVALQSLELFSEPRSGMTAIATVEPGVLLTWRSGDTAGEYVRVEAGDHRGYARRSRVAKVE